MQDLKKTKRHKYLANNPFFTAIFVHENISTIVNATVSVFFVKEKYIIFIFVWLK